jgi:putative tricarboxylic transport membrane protein
MVSKLTPQAFDRIGFLFFIGLALFMGYHSWRLGLGQFSHPGPGLIPLMASVMLLFVVTVQVTTRKEGGLEAKPTLDLPQNWKTMAFIALSLLAYGLVIETLGFVLTTFLWLFFLFELSDPKRWKQSLIGAFITTAICFVLFVLLCRLQLPMGPLGF